MMSNEEAENLHMPETIVKLRDQFALHAAYTMSSSVLDYFTRLKARIHGDEAFLHRGFRYVEADASQWANPELYSPCRY